MDLISTKINRTCSKCGKPFEAKIFRVGEREASLDTCPLCREKEREAENIELAEQELSEAIKEQRLSWHLKSGIELKYQSKTFDNFERSRQPKAFDAVKKYKSGSMVLLSPSGPEGYGIGKTHLVCALANHLIETAAPASYRNGSYYVVIHPCPVHFTREASLLSRIRQTFNQDGETDEAIYSQLSKVPLLIIDDVGKVRPKDLSFTQSVYFRVIDDHYNNEKPIILTTNLLLDELEAHIGGACADRLREMAGVKGFVKMKGQSFRREL